MTAYFRWEENLLNLALKAFEHNHTADTHNHSADPLLQQAYSHCEDITRANSRTFYMASGLLPGEKKRSIRALYAFCRVTDDIVDYGGQDSDLQLKTWERQSLHPNQNHQLENLDGNTLVALAWCDTRKRHSVPMIYAEQLINGVEHDLHKRRYATFNELAAYCYGVACTVGLMSMHITGYTSPEAFPYAIRLGVALQLTNILRDIGEDWRMGRLYIPKEELDAFNLDEEDFARGNVTKRWRQFMQYQIQRVRLLYSSALPGIKLLHIDGRFSIGAAAELYQAILTEIEKNDYDVFSRRASVSSSGKLRRLPGIWWRTRTGNYPANFSLHSLS